MWRVSSEPWSWARRRRRAEASPRCSTSLDRTRARMASALIIVSYSAMDKKHCRNTPRPGRSQEQSAARPRAGGPGMIGRGRRRMWLLKTGPSGYAYDDLARGKRATWCGVKNPVALPNRLCMTEGDAAPIYHPCEWNAVGVTD